MALAGVSAVVGCWTAYRFRIGVALHRHLAERCDRIGPRGDVARPTGVWCQLVRMVLAGGVGVGVSALAAATHGPPPVPLGAASAAAVIAEVDARSRNLVASNLSINGMVYLSPVLALAGLWLFDTVRGPGLISWSLARWWSQRPTLP